MPKYLMNGAYFYDFIKDLPIMDPFGHAYKYFAQYPALSLGHHPLLLGIIEAPFYAVFGISVFSARLTIVFFMLLAAVGWFLLIRAVYDETIAFLSSLLFVTTPFIVEYSRIVMSEIPALSLIIISTYFFYQYGESGNKKHVVASAFCFLLSLYAKHLTIFMVPVFLIYLISKKGLKYLFRKELILSSIIIIILVAPLIVITLKYSQSNINWVANKTLTTRLSLSNLTFYLKVLWKYHFTIPVLLVSLISICVSVYKRDKRTLIFFLWIIGCYIFLASLGIHKNARYAIYWVPAFSLFAVLPITFFQHRIWKLVVSIMLFIITGNQLVIVMQTKPAYAIGYEQAARYVVENIKGESVLYSGIKDTGYFIFFVRKHDPDRDIIVLRADKILATSVMNYIADDRITKREEIYEVLNDFGVVYVVIEDLKSESQALEWLREEVKSSRFVLSKEIVLRTSKHRLNNVPLAIYEYKGYTPPKEGAMLDMSIPLMGGYIKIPFNDLLR